MQEKGFELVATELLSFKEQVRLFSEADIIVGPSGAAFANIIFCQPGTKVIPLSLGEGHFADLSLWPKLGPDLDIIIYLMNESGIDHAYKWFSSFVLEPIQFGAFIDSHIEG